MSLKGFEYINCPLCEKNETELKFTAQVQSHQKGHFSFDEWNFVECKNCGFIYVNPRINEEVNQKYYQFDLDGDQDFIQSHFIEAATHRIPYWQRMVRVVQKFQKSGNLLDIGCGNGAFLTAAQEAGFSVIGQDISDYFIQYNRDENEIFVLKGELYQLHLQEGYFDVISCFDVIEHHRNPKALLSEIKRLLKPGGLLIISTHDIGNYFAKIYGSKWRMIYPIGHLQYFTRETMNRMLSQLDFDIVRITGANNIDDHMIKEFYNYVKSFFMTIVLRMIILFIYKPFMNLFPTLQGWKFQVRDKLFTHELILFIAGKQIISNDELVAIVRTNR